RSRQQDDPLSRGLRKDLGGRTSPCQAQLTSPNEWVVLGAFETEEQCRAANPLSVATRVEEPSERPGEAVPLLSTAPALGAPKRPRVYSGMARRVSKRPLSQTTMRSRRCRAPASSISASR